MFSNVSTPQNASFVRSTCLDWTMKLCNTLWNHECHLCDHKKQDQHYLKQSQDTVKEICKILISKTSIFSTLMSSIWVGFPRTGILAVSCHFAGPVLPNLILPLFYCSVEIMTLSVKLPQPQTPINSLQCTVMHSKCTKNALLKATCFWCKYNRNKEQL